MKLYNLNCSKCKKNTLHSISKMNRKRGVKLSCILCLNERNSYMNFQKLKEFKVK